MKNSIDLNKIFKIIQEIDVKEGDLRCPDYLKESVSIERGTHLDSFLYKINVTDSKGSGDIVEIKIFR